MEKGNLNLNTVLLLIVLVGLIVLYILFFTAGSSSGGSSDSTANQADMASGPRIVYVNIDTLNAHYAFVEELKDELEGEGSRMQREVLNEQAALEKEAADFQQKIASNSLTEARAQAVYEELMKRQQALIEKKERYTQIVAEKEFNMNLQLLDSVNQFLTRYNRLHQYDYILAFRTAGEILVANDSLDITPEVIQQLNEAYQTRKK